MSLLATIISPSSCWGGEATAADVILSQPVKGGKDQQEGPGGVQQQYS